MNQRRRAGRDGVYKAGCSRRAVVLASWLLAAGMLLSASFAHVGRLLAQLLHLNTASAGIQQDPLPPQTSVPAFFDFEAYLFFNPDLASLTQPEAEQHYLAAGRAEGRLARRISLHISYRVNFGLCNQLFQHIRGISFARAFLPHAEVTVITKHAWGRDSYNVKESEFEEQPLESLFDWPRMVAHLRETLGLTLAKTQNSSHCAQVDISGRGKLSRLTRSWQYTAPQAAAAVAGLLGNQTRPALGKDPDIQPCVHVNLGSMAFTTFSLNRPPGWAVPAARAVCTFAPEVLRAAEAILKAMEALGHKLFHSAHLRIEQDWTAFRRVKGGEEEMLRSYIELMQRVGFTNSSVVYAASGAFGYKNATEVAQLKARFRAAGVCGEMYHKGELVPLSQLAAFHSEQLALVDLLVVSQGQAMVGHSLSTFSVFAREYRALVLGLPKSTFYSVTDDPGAYMAFAPPYP